MFKIFYCSFFYFFISTIFNLCAQDNRPFTVFSDGQCHVAAIDSFCSQSLFIKKISYESDVVLQEAEFFYLLGFNAGDTVSKEHFVNALLYMHKKNKFECIKIIVTEESDGVFLHFIFTSLWTFHNVRIKGIFRGKAFFEQCYLMNNGDVFDKEKHTHSIAKIKESLTRDGYYNNVITSNFRYHPETKEITVYITINKGKRFFFGTNSVHVIMDGKSEDNDYLKTQLQKKLTHRFAAHAYNRSFLEQGARFVKNYCERKGFLQTEIQIKEEKNKDNLCVNLFWKITVNHKREFVFSGNKFFSNKQLHQKLLDFGNALLLLPAQLLSQELLNAYKAKGFWQTEIMVEEEKNRSLFVIKEGMRARIKSVEIRDVNQQDTSFIKNKCFNNFLKKRYYDLDEYNIAVDQLIQQYIDAGFLSCAVVEHVYENTDNAHEYKLVVIIDAGTRNLVQEVHVEGYPELNVQGPFAKINKTSASLPLTFRILDEQRTWLIDYFKKIGYLFPCIKSEIEKKGENVSIMWRIEPGEKICFGKTIVLGSMTFPFDFFMNTLAYRSGDLWNQEKIKQTFKLLKNLEIFDSLALSSESFNSNNEKTIIVKAYPDDSYEIRMRAGFELQHIRKYQTFNGITYKIGGTALMKNPFKCGDQFRFDVDFAHSHREIIACYKKPFFLLKPLVGVIQIYSTSYDQPGFIGSVNDIYTFSQNGFLLSVRYKKTLCDLVFNSGCEWMKTSVKNKFLQQSLARAIDFQPQLIDQSIAFLFVEPTFMFEYCDNVLDPTRGAVSLLSFKGMIPVLEKYRKSFFCKFLGEQSFFIPLYPLVLALRVRLGHIFYREFSAIMPSERFYLGGSHSLRGYQADLAPPLGVFVDEERKEHVVPRGGKSMFNVNIELRFPLYKKIGGVFFQDMGILSGNTRIDFKKENLLGASGFGLRLGTPLGPLRFDIGWRWKQHIIKERSFAWFLTFGQAF